MKICGNNAETMSEWLVSRTGLCDYDFTIVHEGCLVRRFVCMGGVVGEWSVSVVICADGSGQHSLPIWGVFMFV